MAEYFKIATVKGTRYLQIWDKTLDGDVLLWHVGSARKILKMKGVSFGKGEQGVESD